jgi:hypothetical protein
MAGQPGGPPSIRVLGSDRQGRGRLLEALRSADVPAREVAGACGWPQDVARAERVAAALVEEGFARWRGDTGKRVLRLG